MSCFNFFRMESVFPPFIKCENISFKSVKISFIYDKVCFIILSTRYHTLPTHYRMRYRIIIDNFYNIQHMTFFSAISDALLFMLLCILKGISTYLCHFQRVTTRYPQFYKKKVIVYFFFKNFMVTRGNASRIVQIFFSSIQNVC